MLKNIHLKLKKKFPLKSFEDFQTRTEELGKRKTQKG
jgi:hypothetical protein